MIIKLLSVLDIATAVIILIYQYGNLKTKLLISFIAYLIIKAYMFRGDFASFIDLCIAIYMIIMIFYTAPILTWIAAIYLIQKSIVGFIM